MEQITLRSLLSVNCPNQVISYNLFQNLKYSLKNQPYNDDHSCLVIANRLGHLVMKLVFVTSQLTMQHYGVRAKTGWPVIRIMCRSGATCLPVDCYSSELPLSISNEMCWSSTMQISSPSFHQNVTCFRRDIAEKLLNWI